MWNDIRSMSDWRLHQHHHACVWWLFVRTDHEWIPQRSFTVYILFSFSLLWTWNHDTTEHFVIYWRMSGTLTGFIPLSFSCIHSFSSCSALLGTISILIKNKCTFFQFPWIINLSMIFFFMSNSPDGAAPSTWSRPGPEQLPHFSQAVRSWRSSSTWITCPHPCWQDTLKHTVYRDYVQV